MLLRFEDFNAKNFIEYLIDIQSIYYQKYITLYDEREGERYTQKKENL